MENNYKTVVEYIENTALSKGVDSLIFKENSFLREGILTTIEDAELYSSFLKDILNNFRKNIKKIGFLYQEKEKELPLSFGKNLAKKLGFKIKPNLQQGEIKKDTVNPQLIKKRIVNKDVLEIITFKDEWKRLNALSKESYGFSAPYIETLEDLCFRLYIPLENIVELEFKPNNFLDNLYQEGLK